MQRLAPALPLVLLLSATASQALAAGNVIVVDDDGGPGVDFTTISAAVAAAGPTDTILIKDGTYAAFAVNGKGVSMVADSGATVAVNGSVQIFNQSSSDVVVLNGLDISSNSGTALDIFFASGLVWIESCTVLSSGIPVFGLNSGVRVSSCQSVLFSDCMIESGAGAFGGDVGLRASLSTVHLYDTTTRGGVISDGVAGSAGLAVSGSSGFASGCTFIGGTGGGGTLDGPLQICTDGAQGGPGLQVNSSGEFELFDCTLVGGPGGAAGGPGCSDGAAGPGSQVAPDSTLTDLAPILPARHYDIPSPIRSGQVGQLSFTATPGELCWATFSVGMALVDSPLFTGTLALDAPLILVYVGTVPAGGTLNIPVNVTLPAGVEYALAYEQALFFSLEDEFVLGTPRTGWVLAAGF